MEFYLLTLNNGDGGGAVGGEGDDWAQNVHKPQLFHRTSLNRE